MKSHKRFFQNTTKSFLKEVMHVPQVIEAKRKRFNSRLYFLLALVTLCFGTLIYRQVTIVVQPPEHIRLKTVKPLPSVDTANRISNRADMVDRNGILLSTNLKSFDLYYKKVPSMRTSDKSDTPAYIAQELASFVGKSPERLERIMSHSASRVLVARDITPIEHKRIHQLGIPQFEWHKNETRALIQPIFSHAVGYTGFYDKKIEKNVQKTVYGGLVGAEYAFENRLANNPEQAFELSFDARLQARIYPLVKEAVEKFQAISGSVVVANIKTGEVLALVSLPDFDPDRPPPPSHPAFRSMITDELLELGSVFKIVNTALYLEVGNGKLEDRFDATKPYKLGKYLIRDYHGQNRILNVAETFVHSSNIASARIAEAVGAEQQKQFFHDIALMNCKPLEFGACNKVLSPKIWNKTAAVTLSYGHGFATTPVSFAASVSGLLNNGQYVPFTVEKYGTVARNGRLKKQTHQIIDPDTSKKLRQLMRLNVMKDKGGSGRKADIEGYMVGGKTGTANKLNAEKTAYLENERLSSFIAAFPMTDPQYLIFTLLDNPKGIKETFNYATAGWNAVPLTRQIIKEMISLYAIPPVFETTEQELTQDPLGINNIIIMTEEGHSG